MAVEVFLEELPGGEGGNLILSISSSRPFEPVKRSVGSIKQMPVPIGLEFSIFVAPVKLAAVSE